MGAGGGSRAAAIARPFLAELVSPCSLLPVSLPAPSSLLAPSLVQSRAPASAPASAPAPAHALATARIPAPAPVPSGHGLPSLGSSHPIRPELRHPGVRLEHREREGAQEHREDVQVREQDSLLIQFTAHSSRELIWYVEALGSKVARPN